MGFLGDLFGSDTSALTAATEEDRRRANEFYARLAQLQGQYQQGYNAQTGQVGSLDQVIRGNAPSVAGGQLQRTLGDIGGQVASQAAGATGQNAALANYGAVQALGTAGAKANQDAAVMRAQEVAEAQRLKAQILAQQQQGTGSMFGVNTQGGTALSGQATGAAGQVAGINAQNAAANRAFAGNLINAFGGGAMAYGLRPPAGGM